MTDKISPENAFEMIHSFLRYLLEEDTQTVQALHRLRDRIADLEAENEKMRARLVILAELP